MKYAFKFVCQKGKLEAQAVLLAASLKKYLKSDHELIVAVPGGDQKICAGRDQRYAPPLDLTICFLKKLGVRIAGIINDTGNPFNNPLYCLALETDAKKSVLMDSDILCMREFFHEPRFDKVSFNAKQAHKDMLGPWGGLFEACGVRDPLIRIPTTVSHEYLPPYFNAGFIAIDTVHVQQYTKLAMECHDSIMAAKLLKDPFRHFIPQISLSIAMLKLKIPYEVLDDRYNYPMRYCPVVAGGEIVPYFCHYHTPEDILREPSGAVRALVKRLAEEHAEIPRILEHFPDYYRLLQDTK